MICKVLFTLRSRSVQFAIFLIGVNMLGLQLQTRINKTVGSITSFQFPLNFKWKWKCWFSFFTFRTQLTIFYFFISFRQEHISEETISVQVTTKKIKKEKDFILRVRREENNKCWQEQKKCAYDRDILIKKEKEERKKRQNTKISSKTFLFEIILRYFDTLRSASLLFFSSPNVT
jgi:hypothetical protein